MRVFVMWAAVLWGCGDATRVEALQDELDVANTRIEALEARVQALEAAPADHADDRDARRQALLERLEQRRAARGAVANGPDGSDETGPGEWRGAETLRAMFAADNTLDDVSRMGRFLLHRGGDGEFDGYRASAIRRGSLLDRLGIYNGDILHSVNGHALTSMEEAMQAYSAVTGDADLKTLTLAVTRRGVEETITIDLDAPIAEMQGRDYPLPDE